MYKIDLKKLLDDYTKVLCDKKFIFTLSNNKRITVVFFRESFCHLIGLQHVFDSDKHYLGKKGYEKIEGGLINQDTLKKHNKKEFNKIKERLKHFNEILFLLQNGQMVFYKQENVYRNTRITADFIIYYKEEKYTLHLFLRQENNSDIYTPVSFVVQTESDENMSAFLTNQTRAKIIHREEIS